MSQKFSLESLQKSIENHINECIEEIINQEIENITERVTRKVRGKIGEIAASCLSYYDIRMDRNQMVITVNTKDIEV